MFQRIFIDGEKYSLRNVDISAQSQPEWFQSRWAWKVICLFDNAVLYNKEDLDEAINQAQKNDPCFHFILSSTFSLDSRSLASKLALDEKSKNIILIWLRYSLAGKGFDVSEQWLDRFLREPLENQRMSAEEACQFKFPEGYPGNQDACDSHLSFSGQDLKVIGIESNDVCINRQPASMPYSLWLVVLECSHWLQYCQKTDINPLSSKSIQPYADLAFLQALLHRFFSADVSPEVKPSLPETEGKLISYNPLAWARLQMELILDRLSIDYYPEFCGWRGWLESGKSS